MYDGCQLGRDSYQFIREIYSPYVHSPPYSQINKFVRESKEKLIKEGLKAVVSEENEDIF